MRGIILHLAPKNPPQLIHSFDRAQLPSLRRSHQITQSTLSVEDSLVINPPLIRVENALSVADIGRGYDQKISWADAVVLEED